MYVYIYNIYKKIYYNEKICQGCNKKFYRLKEYDKYENNICSVSCIRRASTL